MQVDQAALYLDEHSHHQLSRSRQILIPIQSWPIGAMIHSLQTSNWSLQDRPPPSDAGQDTDGIKLEPMWQLAEAKNVKDNWTGVTTKAERRKRQNRLNQRAHRRRKATKVEPYPGVAQESSGIFRVWHLLPKDTPKKPEEPVALRAPVIETTYDTSSHGSSQSRSTSPETLSMPTHSCPRQPGLDFTADSLAEELGLNVVLPSVPYSCGRMRTARESHDLAMFQQVQRRICKAFSSTSFATPFGRDALQTVIHFNVYRAVMVNLRVLQVPPHMSCLKQLVLAESLASGAILEESIPPDLRPSELQLNVAHDAYIDFFPHPIIRDNLIRAQGKYDKQALSDDLVGEIFCHPAVSLHELPAEVQQFLSERKEAILAAQKDGKVERQGLICWGDPWECASWEVTPGFLRKWAWTLSGCEGMWESSNRWRKSREEDGFAREEFGLEG